MRLRCTWLGESHDRQMDTDKYEPGKIFVGGLSWGTTKENLERHFSHYGKVQDTIIMIDPMTKNPRGFGFVTMADPSVVNVIMQDHLKKKIPKLDGKIIDPKPAVIKTALKSIQQQGMPETGPVMASGSCEKKIFLGGLSQNTSEDEIKAYFSTFGTVTEVDLKKDPGTDRMRGFGFVAFESKDIVDSVVAVHFHTINGKRVEAKAAQPRAATAGAQARREEQQAAVLYSQQQNFSAQAGYHKAGGYDYSGQAAGAGFGGAAYGAAAAYQQQQQQYQQQQQQYSHPNTYAAAGYPGPSGYGGHHVGATDYNHYNTQYQQGYNRYQHPGGPQQPGGPGSAQPDPTRMDYGHQQQQMAGYPQQDGRAAAAAYHGSADSYSHPHQQPSTSAGYGYEVYGGGGAGGGASEPQPVGYNNMRPGGGQQQQGAAGYYPSPYQSGPR